MTRVEAWPPRWLTPVPVEDLRRGDGEFAADFIEALCKITKESVAGPSGSPMVLRPWQRHLLEHVYARRPDGRYRHRQALIGVARKNGKSALGAGLALHGLVAGPPGGEVYSCAADKEQARIVFGTARRMVEMEPDLADAIKLYKDTMEVKATGSVYRVLSAEAFTKEGLNPTKVLFDEVHAQPTRELWDVMALAMGARVEPLMIGITTAGVRSDTTGKDSLCYGMYQYGRRVATGEVPDQSFFMGWWEPEDQAADHRAVETWREANPGYDDLVSREDFESGVLKTLESEWRTKRCNQWVSAATAWLPAGSWEACEDRRPIPDGAPVVLGFDGSFSNDSTALVAVELGDDDQHPHIDVVECWEKPPESGQEWRVDIMQVEDAIRQACRKYDVQFIACDPYRWSRTYQVLEDEGLPIVEFPQSPARMVPATQRFYEAVLNKQVTHSGDERLARHVDNCTVHTDSRGSRLRKDSRNSPRKIDLAIAGVMAHQWACEPPIDEEEVSEPWVMYG